MSPRDWSDHGENVPHELVSQIGYLVFVFNDLEEVLTFGICSLLNGRTDDIGHIVTRSHSYGQKVNLFRELVEHRLEKLTPKSSDLTRLPKLTEELKRAAEERNAAVHGAWMTFDPRTSTVGTKIRIKQGKIERSRKKFTEEGLTETIDWIELLSEQLYEFQEDILALGTT